MRRRVGAVASGVIVVAALAACVDSEPPQEPEGDLPLADARFWVGPPEIVMGPSTYVDSFFTAIKVGDTVRGYVGNRHTMLLEGSSAADVEPTGDHVIEAGTDATLWDDCGAWLEGVERDEEQPGLLRAWYHAEWRCNYAIDQTDKSIAYAESRDGGRTFTKVGYPDNQVVSSPTPPVASHRNGRGDLTVIRRGEYYYMYYLSVLPDLKTVTSVARAPVTSGGVPGTWRNYTVDEDGHGSWTEDARGGTAAPLETFTPASSASVHVPSGEVVLARQHPDSGGIVLQAATDGLDFTALPEPLVPFLGSQTREPWGVGTDGQIIGYVSAVAPDGSRNWTDEFYLFHTYVFPGDELRSGRYLVRRRVVIDEAPVDGPWSVVALSSYVDAGGDRYATSAPEKEAGSHGVVGHLLATPAEDRLALFECRSAGGDRFVGAACGATAQRERLVGYSFAAEQTGTAGLYRCATSAGEQYASLDAECEGGRKVSELGYVYPPGD